MSITLSELLGTDFKGFTGSQGVIGFTGSRGFTGSQGIQGFTGSVGFTGSQGIQGLEGFTGSRGFTGSQGIIGFVGSQSTNNAVALWDGISGGSLKNSTMTVSIDGDVSVARNFNRSDVVFARSTATHTLTSTTAAQKMFGTDVSSTGAVFLRTGTYYFYIYATVNSMSATNGNAAFSIAAGSATISGIRIISVGVDTASPPAAASMNASAASLSTNGANAVTAAVSTSMLVEVRGYFNVTAEGTVIPSIALTTAAAASMAANNVFYAERIADESSNTKGTWS